MKFNINLVLIILLFFMKTIYPQIVPNTIELNGGTKAGKTVNAITPNSNNIGDIAVIGDTIWIGSGAFISRTTDSGKEWTNFTDIPVRNAEGITAMAYDKYNKTIWVASNFFKNTIVGIVETGGGLRFTSDNGESWTSIPQPVDKDSTSDTIIVYGNNIMPAVPVTVAEQNITYDIAFTPGTVWITSWSAGLRKSTDMGNSWQRVLLPPDFLDSVKPTDSLNFCYTPAGGKICKPGNLNLSVFSVLTVDSLTLYVGTAGGINKSTDGGVSWTKFTHTNQANAISGNWVIALAYNYFDNTIWASTRRANGESEYNAVSYSKDGGLNWYTTLPNQIIENFAFQGSRVIAAADNGIFMTSDNGKNWTSPGIISDAVSGISLKTNQFISAAFQGNDIWIGSVEGLAKLTGNTVGWNGTWKVFAASKTLSSSTDTYAYPNPFNPNTDILKIKYATNGNSIPVTIRIFDFSMHFVRTVIQDAARGNTIHVVDNSSGTIDYWDGKNDNGSIVPNGVYFYCVNTGSDKPVYGKILVLR
jgi:hypothetical protein